MMGIRRAACNGPLLRALSPALAALLTACTNCSSTQKPSATPADARGEPAARLVVIADLEGYLEPCGCQSRPLGGIDKLAASLKGLRDDDVPTVTLAAGNLFFQPEGLAHHGMADEGAEHDEGRPTQALWKARTLATILGRLDIDALAPGAEDLSADAALAEKLKQASGGRWLVTKAGTSNANVPEDAGDAAREPPGGSVRVVEARALKIGIWSTDPRLDSAHAEQPLDRRALDLTQEARRRGADVVVGIVHAGRRRAMRAASTVKGLDFVVHAGLGEAPPSPPRRRGSTSFLSAGEHGQGLLVLDLFPAKRKKSQNGWTDVGRWAREREAEALRERIEVRKTRIAEWEKDPDVREADLARQQERLRAMQAELKALEHSARTQGDVFVARWVELGPEAPADPAIAELLKAHFRRVNQHNRRALADRRPVPLPEGHAGYVGSASCQDCHSEAYAWWKGHPHGRAYPTLVERDKQFNLECVSCHVTGYRKPGGSTVTHVDALRNVGCESCHGPGSLHVKAPEQNPLRREVPEPICKDCHNAEHSDQFDYPTYRAMLLVPGHGRPLREDRSAAATGEQPSKDAP